MSGTVAKARLSRSSRKVVEAICETIIPGEGPGRPGALEMNLPDRLMEWLGQMSGAGTAFVIVCWLWEFCPLQYGRLARFSHLTLSERTRTLEQFEHSRFFFRRITLLGLKAVLMAAFYHNPEVYPYIGYQEGCLSPPPPAPPA